MTGRHREKHPFPWAPVVTLMVAAVPASLAVYTATPKAPAPSVQVVATPPTVTGWHPAPAVKAVAYVKPQRVPALVGATGLVPKAVTLAKYLQSTYPTITEIGGVRPDPIRDHPAGLALDVMVFGDTSLGDRIYADMKAQKSQFGIRYMLWRKPKHFDHIHICVVG